MSNTRNFRIAINLSNFFHDHRNRARIFINNDIQTIRDLEERIEKIFHVNNFHLTSQNEFLPPTEDVRILEQNDIIWVVPSTYQQPATSTTTCTEANNSEDITNKKRSVSLTEECLDQTIYPPRKKKKKSIDLEKSMEVEALNSSKDQCPKKKKHKVSESSITKGETDTTVAGEQSVPASKKKKKKESRDSNNSNISEALTQNVNSSLKINTLLPVLQLHINSYNKKLNKANKLETSSVLETSAGTDQSESQPEVVAETKESYKCKGSLFSYKKKVSVPTITDKYLQEKKVNIVKIEYLSGGPMLMNQLNMSKYRLDNDIVGNSCNIHDNGIQNLTECESRKGSMNKDDSEINGNRESTDTYKCPIEFTPKKDESVKPDTTTIPKNDLTNIITTAKQTIAKENEINYANEMQPDYNKKRLTKDDVANISDKNSNESVDSEKFCKLDASPQNIRKNAFNYTPKKSIESIHSSADVNEKVIDTVLIKDNSFAPPELSKTAEISLRNSNIYDHNSYNRSCDEPSPNFNETNSFSLKSDDTKSRELTEKEYQQQLLENNPENETIVVETEKTCDKTTIRESNNLTTNSDMLNENVTFESETQLADIAVMDDAILTDTSKNSDFKDVSTTVDRLSISTITSRRHSSFSRRKRLSGIGQLLGELRSTEASVTGESMDSDPSEEFVTKRRRKRTRKRYRKNKEANTDTSLDNSTVETPTYVPKPMTTKACPTMHLKFEEDGDCLKTVDVTEKPKQPRKLSESYVESSFIENVTIESDAEESNVPSFNIKEELILKSPSIKNLLPRIGDIIAFKILRITENYTPEVSSYIIGKVLEYNSDSKTVTFEILNGLEQCEEPQGKLTAVGEEDNVNEINSNKKEFAWTDVIDPRLLFP